MAEQQPLKTRPIILRLWEVRGLLDGTVTQLWRAMKRQPKGVLDPWNDAIEPGEVWMCRGWPVRCVESRGRNKAAAGELTPVRLKCPYGVPGDRLWGRESWVDVHPLQAEGRYSQEGQAGIPGPPGVTYRTIYRADGEYPPIWHATGYPYRALKPGDDLALKHWPKGVEYGWEPSTSMPLWASRVTLDVLDVQPVRVREAMRGEGMYRIADFGSRWDQDNPRHPYASNPWAWRLVVRRVTT